MIRAVEPYHAQVINKSRYGDMLIAGESLLILETEPAGYVAFGANEALKAARVKLIDASLFGAYGRLYLSGPEAQIDAARDAVRRSALHPSMGRYQILVVEDADRLTDQAANALLKSIEEPAPGTVWLLCAPAVLVILLVTAYPIGYAVVLSLQSIDLRFPGEGGFVGLENYGTVLSSPLWWQSVFNTAFITVVSVAIEFVIGMALALVMHRAIFGRGLVRTTVLIPYGIITVVAAFAWFFAFDPATGFVNSLPFIAESMTTSTLK